MSNEHDGWAKFRTEIGNGDFRAGLRAIDEATANRP